MTVAELIERLQKLPADLPVYLGDWNEQYAPDHPMDKAIDGPVVAPPESRRRGVKLPNRVVIG